MGDPATGGAWPEADPHPAGPSVDRRRIDSA